MTERDVAKEFDWHIMCHLDWKEASAEVRAEMYRQLDWIRYDMKRKVGWVAYTYKDLFGVWPEAWMKDLTPHLPHAKVAKLIRSRDRKFLKKFKEGRKRERDARAKVLGRVAPAEETNDYQRGNGAVEGQSALPLMARGGGTADER